MRCKTARKKGGKTMDNMVKIFSNGRFVLTGVIIIMLMGIVVNVADAPPLEAVNPGTVQCYQIDDSGRIIDSSGRLRGWIRGNEVYNPGLELKYRLSGSHLKDIN